MESVSFCLIVMLAIFPRDVFSVPDEFCLDAFDDGDCGEQPVSVFYYYKSGSRCEIRTWRGCPTLNRFPDYFSCSHFCIGRIWGDPLEIPVLSVTAEVAEKEKAAKIGEIVQEQFAWKKDLQTLEVKEITIIDKILDDVVEEVQHQHHKLSLQGGDEDNGNEDEDEDEEYTTYPYPTARGSYSFEEEEVVVLP